MSQKTYEACFLPPLRVYGGELSQKHGCGAIVRRSQLFWLPPKFYLPGADDLLPHPCTLKALKYTKYSYGFQSLACVKISACPAKDNLDRQPCFRRN